jgi:hypothetical protein
MDENKPRRRWLSFGIRDLLWAMALVAMGLGWWLDHQRSREREQTAMIRFNLMFALPKSRAEDMRQMFEPLTSREKEQWGSYGQHP